MVGILNNKNKIKAKEICVGSTVKIKDFESDEIFVYSLVYDCKANADEGLVSVCTPVGKKLLGCKENEIVEIEVPAGILKFKILKVS